jgi:dienelactone hydrolase
MNPRTRIFHTRFGICRSLIFPAIMVLSMISANVFAETSRPQIIITPGEAMMDQKVTIRLQNFIPDQVVTLHTRLSYQGNQWSSKATYQVNSRGIIDLGSQPSLGGSYKGVEPMGLFWSLAPVEEKLGERAANIMQITATINNHLIAAGEFLPILVKPGVVKKMVRSNGLVGTFYYPKESESCPGVIILDGPEGGLNETQAATLAAHGYASLALAYSGIERLPRQLSKIPLEYFETAIHWLQSQDMVAKDKIGILGTSKGAELGLLLGANFPAIRTVVAYSPSAVVWQSPDFSDKTPASSWTYRGKQLPYVPFQNSLLSSLWSKTPYKESLKNKDAVSRASIPVEKINGPVLLISGRDDQIWPSVAMAQSIMKRLKKNHHPYPDKHLSYPEAGHILKLFYLPSTTFSTPKNNFGGTLKSNYQAGWDSWAKAVNFLDQTLQPGHK